MAWLGSTRLVVREEGTQERVVGWYAPVEVVDGTRLWREVEVGVQMRLVAVGWKAEGYNGAVAFFIYLQYCFNENTLELIE